MDIIASNLQNKISEKIASESEQVLSKFLEDKKENPTQEDIINQNKFGSYEILKRDFSSGVEKIYLNLKKFNYEDFVTYTPGYLRIFIYIILGLTLMGSILLKSWVVAGVGFSVFFAGMLFNFYRFQVSILKKAQNDFCAFEHWYEKGIISFKYKKKTYNFPDNWSVIMVHERLETNRI